MAKDYDALSEDEQELHEAMQVPPSDEPEAEEAKTPPRGPDGKFAKSEPEEPEAEDESEEAEPAQESAPEPEAEEPDKRYVPLDALHSERGKRKDAEAELADLRQQLQQLQQMVQRPQPQQPQPQAEAEEPPDPLVDKAGYDAYWHRKLAEVSKPIQEQREREQQQQQYQSAVQQLHQYAVEHEQEFRKEYGDRDYDGALGFMRDRTRKNLKLMGVPDGQLDQVLAQEEMKLTATAYQRGMNPAALVYNMALNSGFQPEAQASQPSEADKVRRLGEAQKQTKSASGVSGAAREDEVSVEQLANMSQAELAKLTDKDPDLVRRLLGG